MQAEIRAMREVVLVLAMLALAGCSGELLAGPAAPHGAPRFGTPTDRPVAPSELPAPDHARIWRLTAPQYENTVRDLLGTDREVRDLLLADSGAHGFANGVENVVREAHMVIYARIARELAAETVADPARLARIWPCASDQFDDAVCQRRFVETFGLRALRRPLGEDEIAGYVALLGGSLAELDGPTAVALVIETMLQTPSFLFRTELGVPSVDRDLARTPMSAYERASMLAYLLWNTMPDDRLFEAATDGSLLDPAVLRAEAERMMDDPRALSAVGELVLGLVGYEHLDPQTRPTGVEDWDATRRSMRAETIAFVQYVVLSGETEPTMRELYTADYHFVDRYLAPIYGIEGGDTLVRVPTESPERIGLLTHAGVLAAHSLPDATSPPRRGKLIARRLLCRAGAPPPDNIPIPEGAAEAARTQREFFELVTGEGTCGSACHVELNPPGFAFEHFDQNGRYRTEETNGYAIDSAVDLGALGLASDVGGAADLARQLADSEEAERCFARQFYRYALGRMDRARRGDGSPDTLWLELLGSHFVDRGGDIRALMIDFVTQERVYDRSYTELPPPP
jgi:hypothetical protein